MSTTYQIQTAGITFETGDRAVAEQYVDTARVTAVTEASA